MLTNGRDEEYLSRGVYDAFTKLNLRYSQLSPLSMWDERNTGSNLPGPKSKSTPTPNRDTNLSTSSSSWQKAAAAQISHTCSKRPRPY